MLRAICELLITVKSDHLAIIVFTGSRPKDINKKRTFYNIARVLQTNMLFLAYLFDINWDNVTNVTDTETAFDIFYVAALSMLDTFYPLRTVTVTNRDPYFVTHKIKSLLTKAQSAHAQGENRKG